MIYDEFLALINQNINNQSDYESFCRFCFETNSNGVDVSSECAEAFALQDNYFTVTKQCLQITSEHPNFVCCACEHRLSDIASFVQEIIENGKHWEIYLENEKDVKPERIEEIDCNYHEESVDVTMTIKVENYEFNADNETNVSCVLDSSMDKLSTVHCDGLNISDIRIDTNNKSSRKRKRNTEREIFRTQPTTLEYDRTCKFCDIPTFATLQQFYRHQDREHPGKRGFSCDICGSNFSTKSSTYSHLKERHVKGGSKYHCQHCAARFLTSAVLRRHVRTEHLNVCPYVCNICGKGFYQKKSLKVHMKCIHNAEYETTQKKMVHHHKQSKNQVSKLYLSHLKKVISCTLDDPSRKNFISEDRIIRRNLEHRKFECDVCRNTFTSQATLNSHKLTHSVRPFKCTVCNASFNQTSHLSIHFNREHNKNRPFQCVLCNKSYCERWELASHVRWHKQQKMVNCDAQNTLNSRKLIHSDVSRPFVCTVCKASFDQSSQLSVHFNRKHSKNKLPYQCVFCDNCYFEHDELASHVRWHKQQKRVECVV